MRPCQNLATRRLLSVKDRQEEEARGSGVGWCGFVGASAQYSIGRLSPAVHAGREVATGCWAQSPALRSLAWLQEERGIFLSGLKTTKRECQWKGRR